jgi:hypothetical protein
MNSDQVGGIVRALLAAIGGFLVARGVTDAGTVNAVAGAVATVVVAVWSAFTNKPGTTIPAA